MDLMARRRVLLAAGKKPRLPKEYQEVEYLECDGISPAYLNLNLLVTKTMSFDTTFSQEAIKKYTPLFGSSNNSNTGYPGVALYLLQNDLKNVRWRFGNTTVEQTGVVLEIHRKYHAKLGYRKFELDSITFNATNPESWSTAAYSAYLFSQNIQGDNYNRYCPARVFSFAAYNEEQVIRDLIPCYRKSDNKPGMYDLCGSICPLTNSPFYINAGTGEFLVGPDVN